MKSSLIVNEIFTSLQGEGLETGTPCTFIRLTGCNLRCAWCDTSHAYDEGQEMSVDNLLIEVARIGCPNVEVTGGEPLLQAATTDLLKRLCDEGYHTLLETNGSMDISAVDARVRRIVDFKCPSSRHADDNRWINADLLTAGDEAKFVLADRADYDFAREALTRHAIASRCPVTFSCVQSLLAPADLARWILDDHLSVRLGIQLHKILWPNKDRGV